MWEWYVSVVGYLSLVLVMLLSSYGIEVLLRRERVRVM